MRHFVLEPHEYQRNLDVIPAYRKDAAMYLHLKSGKPLEECQAYVDRETAPGGKFALRDPEVFCLSKNKHWDREPTTMPATKYFQDVVDRQALLSPTMAVYLNPNEKRSLLSMYISGNIARRSAVKHEMFEADMAGNKELKALKKIQQTTYKIKNNALSGAHSSPFTPLYLKSAHSSLTSTCRSATGYGNANNEKFLFGNRHYWSPDVVTANIISIINNSDYRAIAYAMERFNIKEPTVEETVECITYSTDLYWRNRVAVEKIADLISRLSPIQRAAFVYTGDMFHLAKYNDQLMREFFADLSTKAVVGIDDADEWVGKMDADLRAFISLLCAKELDGRTIKDTKVASPEAYRIIGATAKQVLSTLDHYLPIIRAFWVTPNVPASVASLPSCIRRGAITSDTDSTIFTVQWWVEWFSGQIDFTEQSCAIAHSAVYLASQTIIDVLARMTANMGVIPSQIHQLAMKNEFAFPVFSLTSRAKHYFAYISAQEGNVFKELDVEIKGVALKSSNCPPHVMKEVRRLITDTMDSVMSGEGVSVYEVLGRVSRIENDIRHSVESGRYEYLTTGQVKSATAYRNPSSSPYLNYEMWCEVFADKYGQVEAPPYAAVNVPIDADNPTKLKAWLKGMPDREIATRMEVWLKKHGKNSITRLMLPESICGSQGVPSEVICGIAIRRLIYATMEAFYLVLESLGLYMVNDNHTRLVSDHYSV